VIYAEGRDLIVVASVHPGAQLLADGNIHVYGRLKGAPSPVARGARDAQVFCLALEGRAGRRGHRLPDQRRHPARTQRRRRTRLPDARRKVRGSSSLSPGQRTAPAVATPARRLF
jgi:septum formation inhibitor MinC